MATVNSSTPRFVQREQCGYCAVVAVATTSESVCRTEQVHFRFEQGRHVNEDFCGSFLGIRYCEIYCLTFCSDLKFSESQNGTVWVAWIMGDVGHWTWWMWLLCYIKLNNLYWNTILWRYSLILIKFDLYWGKKTQRICNRVSWWSFTQLYCQLFLSQLAVSLWSYTQITLFVFVHSMYIQVYLYIFLFYDIVNFLLLSLFIVVLLSFGCWDAHISPFAGPIKEFWFWFWHRRNVTTWWSKSKSWL